MVEVSNSFMHDFYLFIYLSGVGWPQRRTRTSLVRLEKFVWIK